MPEQSKRKKKGKSKMGKKGLGTLVKGTSGIYMVRTVLNGVVTTKSTHTKNKREAIIFQKELAQKKNDNDSRSIEENIKYHREMLNYYISLQHRKEVKIEDLYEAYKNHPETNCSKGTLRVYKSSISAFVDFLKSKYPKIEMVREITDEMFHDWISAMKEKLGANTVALRITMIQHCIKVLMGGENPLFRTVKTTRHKPQKERRAFTTEEIKAILASAKDVGQDMEIMFYLGFYTGARRSDCAMMKWGSVDFEKGMITFMPIKTQKSGKVVSIPIHPRLLELLTAIKPEQINNGDYICPKNAKNYGTQLSNRINRVLKKSGVKDDENSSINFHCLRHTFCAMNANNGTSQLALQSMLGHSTLQMTSNYYHQDNGAIKEQLEKVLSI